MEPASAKVLVGIVTFNSSAHLEACLQSLSRQTRKPDLIVVWDNASSDDTSTLALKLKASMPGLPAIEVIASKANLGFGPAHNKILRGRDFTHYLLMNPDAALAPEFLALTLEAMDLPSSPARSKGRPVGSVNGMVRYLEGKTPSPIIYSLGHVMYRDRRMEDLGIGEHCEKLEPKGRFLFGTNGACPLLSIAALRDVSYPEGPFDGAYFLYGEDDDLNWRMALAGYVTWLEPRAKAFHDAGASGGFRFGRARRNALANRWLTMVKNENAWLFVRDMPLILLFEVIYSMMRLVRRPAFIVDLFGAKLRFLQLLPHALKRRRQTPVRLDFAQEADLLEPDMRERVQVLLARYTGRKLQRSLWTKTEAGSH